MYIIKMVKRIIIKRPARPRIIVRQRPKYIHRNSVDWEELPMILRVIIILIIIGIVIMILIDIKSSKKNKRRINYRDDENVEIIINERNNWWNNLYN